MNRELKSRTKMSQLGGAHAAVGASQQLTSALQSMSLTQASTPAISDIAAASEETAASLPPITSPHSGETLTLKGLSPHTVLHELDSPLPHT
jgi:hypothetical protein